jgi:hypothetical protein
VGEVADAATLEAHPSRGGGLTPCDRYRVRRRVPDRADGDGHLCLVDEVAHEAEQRKTAAMTPEFRSIAAIKAGACARFRESTSRRRRT